MKPVMAVLLCLLLTLAGCAPVDINASLPEVETGISPAAWASIPAGEFYSGQAGVVKTTPAYQIMATNVTAGQYATFLNESLAVEDIRLDEGEVRGYYPGDTFRGVKHEEQIAAGDWPFIPLQDPSQRVRLDGQSFTAQAGYADHPMTMVTWFGAWAYCTRYGWRLPSEIEWEKAARGTDGRPFPWGEEILPGNANFYASRDPFEDMRSFGSRTSPVGFYNGRSYGDFQTIDSASPYGLYDMAGNVWQWTGDVYEGMHYRFLRGGSKDTDAMDLRVWVRNNATPTYFSPGVGFRCARSQP